MPRGGDLSPLDPEEPVFEGPRSGGMEIMTQQVNRMMEYLKRHSSRRSLRDQ